MSTEVGQEAYCTICKFQFTRFNLQGSTYKNSTNKVQLTRFYEQGSTNKKDLQASEPLKPYFKSKKGISQTGLRCVVLNKICCQFFSYDLRNARNRENYYQRATYKDNLSTFPQPRILFWFTSSSFLRRPVLFKYWLLRPFFYKEATCKSSTVQGLLYPAKAVPSKDYFMHLTLNKRKKGMLSDQPQLSCITSTALLCCWGRSPSKI
jgi:hypothetical protein